MASLSLKEDERIDDLEFKGLKIIQKKEGFCFGIDSVLLSDFEKDIRDNSNVIDLGTGTGILGILLCAKTKLKKIVGVEVQDDIADMAERSIMLNKLEDKFNIVNNNIINLKDSYNSGSFDVVITNPPYKKYNTGLTNINKYKLISRHEIEGKLEDFIRISSYLLKDKGSIYMVHRPDRLVDIISLLRQYKLEPKNMKFVQPKINSSANMVLIKAVKNAKPFLRIEKNLIIYNESGKYTDEILKIYNKNKKINNKK